MTECGLVDAHVDRPEFVDRVVAGLTALLEPPDPDELRTPEPGRSR
jgi:hypothetical protein